MSKRFLIGAVGAFLFSISAFAGEGGNSGGGGDIPPAERVTAEEIAAMTPRLRPLLLSWLNRLEYMTKADDYWGTWETVHGRTRPSSALMGKLFSNRDDVFVKLETLRIDVKMTDGCLDYDGVVRDGSADHENNVICISAARLSKKLSKIDVAIQVRALIAHEVTHVMGGDENDALFLQTIATQDFSDEGFLTRFWTVGTQLEMAIEKLKRLKKAPTDASFQYRLEIASEVAFIARALDGSYSLTALRGLTYDSLSQAITKYRVLWNYACAMNSDLTQAERTECSTRYSVGFGAKSKVTVSEYEVNSKGKISERRIKDATIRKVTSTRLRNMEISDLQESFQSAKGDIEHLMDAEFTVRLN